MYYLNTRSLLIPLSKGICNPKKQKDVGSCPKCDHQISESDSNNPKTNRATGVQRSQFWVLFPHSVTQGGTGKRQDCQTGSHVVDLSPGWMLRWPGSQVYLYLHKLGPSVMLTDLKALGWNNCWLLDTSQYPQLSQNLYVYRKQLEEAWLTGGI